MMDRQKVSRAVANALDALQTDQPNSGEELVIEPDDLDFFIAQITAVRSAFTIEHYLESKGFKDFLIKTPVLELSRKIGQLMYNTPTKELAEWVATIEIATMRELFDENGQPWPEDLR